MTFDKTINDFLKNSIEASVHLQSCLRGDERWRESMSTSQQSNRNKASLNRCFLPPLLLSTLFSSDISLYSRNMSHETSAVEQLLLNSPVKGHEGQCLVCYSHLEYPTLTPCGHDEVCGTCHLRLRFLHGDKKCPMCKSLNEQLICDYSADEKRVVSRLSTVGK